MFFDDYQKVLSEQLVKLQGNRAVIDDAAKAIAEAMKSGHYVFCSAIGHGIQGDARAVLATSVRSAGASA